MNWESFNLKTTKPIVTIFYTDTQSQLPIFVDHSVCVCNDAGERHTVVVTVVQARLDAQLTVNSDEMRQRQEAIARELENIMKRQQQLEATNERLQEKAIDIRRSLNDLDLTDAQYQQLRLVNEDDITLKDFVAVCCLCLLPVQLIDFVLSLHFVTVFSEHYVVCSAIEISFTSVCL